MNRNIVKHGLATFMSFLMVFSMISSTITVHAESVGETEVAVTQENPETIEQPHEETELFILDENEETVVETGEDTEEISESEEFSPSEETSEQEEIFGPEEVSKQEETSESEETSKQEESSKPEEESEKIEEVSSENTENSRENESEGLSEGETTVPEAEASSEVVIKDILPEVHIYDEFCKDSLISKEAISVYDFSSKEIIVGTFDPALIVDKENIVDSGLDMYVLRYETEVYARNAFSYYFGKADFVAPNILVRAADGEGGTGADVGTPLDTFKKLSGASSGATIAVIDSGMPASANVTDRVSVINGGVEVGDDNGHGTSTMNWILAINPNASILSIKALDSNGQGDAVTICAGIEYAINSGAKILLLPLYAYASGNNAAIVNAINEAMASGLTVVGAAGNDGANVKYYVPGNVAAAYIAGACDKNGEKIASSNFGVTVDYNIVADSTSEASAKLAGYLSTVKGSYSEALEKEADKQVLIFRTQETKKSDDDDEETPEMVVKEYEADLSKNAYVRYTLVDKSKVTADDDWHSIMDGDRDKIITTLVSEAKVYKAKDGTYRINADAPWANGVAAGDAIGWVFANGNDNGQTITEGASYNPKTKVATVTEDVLGRIEGDFSNIQMQVLVPVEYNANVNIPITIESKGSIVAQTELAFEMFDNPAFSMLIKGKDSKITREDLKVYVGDIPVNDFSFDEDSNTVVLAQYAATVGSIRVVIDKDIEVTIKVAYADVYNKEDFPAGVAFWLPKGTDVSKLTEKKKVTVAARIGFPDGDYSENPPPDGKISEKNNIGVIGEDNAAALSGYLGFPKNLFGIKFEFCKEDGTPMGSWKSEEDDEDEYNIGMPCYCTHESESLEEEWMVGNKTTDVAFMIAAIKPLSDGTIEFVLAYESETYFAEAGNGALQNLGACCKFRVQPADDGYLQVVKKSADSCIPAGTEAYPFKGIEFEVFTDKDCSTKAKDASGEAIVLTAKESGKTETVKIKAGTYYIREVKSSLDKTGWVYNKDPVKVTVTKDNTAEDPAVVTIENNGNMDPIGILLKKQDEKTGKEERRVGC